MTPRVVQLLCVSAAFWVALVAIRHGSPRESTRQLLGLVAGAALAHWVWCAIHLQAVEASIWLRPDAGYTILALPLGVVVSAPFERGRRAVAEHLAVGWAALLPAMAVAKLGCLAAGCCGGLPLARALSAPGFVIAGHPVPLYEAGAWLLLAFLLSGLGRTRTPSLFAIGFGAIRLATEPLRDDAWAAADPGGAPVWLAVGWVVAGCGLGAWATGPEKHKEEAPARMCGPGPSTQSRVWLTRSTEGRRA